MKYYSMRFGSGDPRTFTGLAPTFLIFVDMTNSATLTPPAITESLTGSGIYQFQWGTTHPIAFLADAATTSPGSSARYVSGELDPADRADEYGTTLVAIGTSLSALGTTSVALGTTSVSWGSAIGSTLGAIGATLSALGTTSVALGTTNVALGTTNVALGTSNIALGTTAVSYGSIIGTTQIAMGGTLVAIGNTLATIGSSLSIIAPGIGSTASSYGNSTTDPVDLFGYLKRIIENLEGNSQFTKITGVWNIQSRGSTLLISKTITNSASMVTKT